MKERYDVFSCAHQVRMPTIFELLNTGYIEKIQKNVFY
ncbi:MAG: hypothetical protein H6Q12_769 [Bacteroidetes bacterium]|nr:hypothetical protein [Bacteroidota bacterium]